MDEARALPGSRRLVDKILIPFHQACDQQDLEVAARLLKIVEVMLQKPAATIHADRRRTVQLLVAAHERLWLLKHPEAQGH
ncbi:hypothetical protein GXW78_20100 [Roseomonas terrae]|uniref:Uncharacterized protein n=1 Tax=Neoroseomonas terrae TaxID=424799 RepID=A0ABS5ELS5_9PROT|nr:hypothetical protein [Neoroseomonas terrae]MBR0651978.1 hypothetical protein [Neoroseomonas terrae]